MFEPKFSVRFYPPHKPTSKEDFSCEIRGKIGYNRKLLPFSFNVEAHAIAYHFTALTSTGTLRQDWQKACWYCQFDEGQVEEYSLELQGFSANMARVIELLVEHELWQTFTQKDAQWFANNVMYSSDITDLSGAEGAFREWLEKKGGKQ